MGQLQILDRLEELYEYLKNFPNSRLTTAIQNEIDYLEKRFDKYGR